MCFCVLVQQGAQIKLKKIGVCLGGKLKFTGHIREHIREDSLVEGCRNVEGFV